MSVNYPLRADLLGIEPYGAPQIDVPHLLNVNENPYSPPAQVVSAIHARIDDVVHQLNRYPDREFTQLREDLAQYLRHEAGVEHVGAENIWAGNGSNEVMQHIFQAFGGPGRKAVTWVPSYSMYPEYARESFTEWVELPRQVDYTIDLERVRADFATHHPAIAVIASPNNPTGTALELDALEQILQLARGSGPQGSDTVVVIDEAYGEFRRFGRQSALTLLPQYPHLVVTRTMSKAFAFAGVRLGYLAAAPELIHCLRIVRLPYHLSAITQAVASAALAHADVLQQHLAALRQERDALVVWLREQGYSAVESDANFVLFGTFPDRHAVWQRLLDRGVLIRETGPAGYLRVSVGTPTDMAAFRQSLQEAVENE